MTISNIPEIETEIETGKKVMPSPPNFLNATIDGNEYKLLAGQQFLNTQKSQSYLADPSSIKQKPTQIYKPQNPENYDENTRVVADGHHRIIWNLHHGIQNDVKLKNIMFCPADEWRDLTFKEVD